MRQIETHGGRTFIHPPKPDIMNAKQEKRLLIWFDEYVGSFTDCAGKLAPMLALKLAHSRRVSADAAGIGRNLGFAEGDVRTAKTLGLLHDVGRFSQFADYKTLRDDHSVNHGHRGVEVMGKCTVLADCSPGDRRRIMAGIKHHNRLHLPGGLRHDSMQFVKIARDADKLDIFFVLYRAWKNGDLRRNPDIALRIQIDGPVGSRALDEIKTRRTVSYQNVKSLADFFLLQLSWVYRLNFRHSYRRLIERAVIDRLAEVLPPAAEIKRQISMARQYAHQKAE